MKAVMHSAADTWQSYGDRMAELFAQLTVSDTGGGLSVTEGLERWHAASMRVRQTGGEIALVGNGASASMASHFAADILKNGGIRTRLFTDSALLTAVSNDIAYEQAFAVPLGWLMQPGDMLVAISSSGASPNVLAAAQTARDKGITVVTLSAFDEDNPLRRLGGLNFYFPARTYGLAENAHAVLLHFWTDRLASARQAEERP